MLSEGSVVGNLELLLHDQQCLSHKKMEVLIVVSCNFCKLINHSKEQLTKLN